MSKILKSLPFFISGLLLLSILFVTGFTNKDEEPIQNLYQVYLDGNEIGLVKSKEEL